MRIDEFMAARGQEPERQTTIMGPVCGIPHFPHRPADNNGQGTAVCDVVDGTDADDEPADSYDFEPEDMQVLKDTYDFMSKIMDDLLCGKAWMEKPQVRALELALGELHFLINQFESFKPEELGIPCIAATLDDQFRETDVDLRPEKRSK